MNIGIFAVKVEIFAQTKNSLCENFERMEN
uniref:Uncharacterized protein n=1 Tax=Arundo donax TaxID=35708 RepID=A0A0A8YL89_ARUDO